MVTAILKEQHYQTRVQGAVHQLLVDEPLELGGKDTGFSPLDLLASSLASCTAITLRMYADRKKWELQEVQVTVSINGSDIDKSIRIWGSFDQGQITRLHEISANCPVSKILSQANKMRSTINYIR